MAGPPTARYAIPTMADTDQINQGGVWSRAAMTAIDGVITGYSSGVFASRPAAAASEGKIYRATDVLDGGPNGTYYLSDGTAWASLVLNSNKGASIIATTETRTNTAYGKLTTPDQVTVTLPANGLITVHYQATWQGSASGAARAAIFLGANQLCVPKSGGGSGSVTQAAAMTDGTTSVGGAFDVTMGSCGVGLMSTLATGYTGDVTTGQALGGVHAGSGIELGGTPTALYAGGASLTGSRWPMLHFRRRWHLCGQRPVQVVVGLSDREEPQAVGQG